MNAEKPERLYWIRLPLREGLPPENVLAMHIGNDSEMTRLVLSDVDHELIQRTIVGTVIPDIYEPSLEDRLTAYLQRHAALHALISNDGGNSHGSLTIARAIHFARTMDLTSDMALDLAKKHGALCKAYCTRLKAQSRPVLN